jgi:hypothetical protein
MKHFRLALVLFASALGLVRAQEESQNRQPPTEIPDFSNLDEYIYEPKSTLIVGFRYLSGAKTQFFGRGTLAAPELATDATTANLRRIYHDGAVQPDARTANRIDSAGNPVIDSVTGVQLVDPIAPDGRTNTWNYTFASQLTSNGFLAFHTYSAAINDPTVRSKDLSSSAGLDVAVSRDMGKLWGTRASWSIIAGISMNDLSAKTAANVQATLTTLTDLYSLDGQVLPAAPYTAPSSSTGTVLDTAGNAVLNSDGSSQSATTDTTVLINNKPIDRTTQTEINSTSVSTRWKLKGAYYSFRAGPAVWVPFTTRLRASVSAGPVLVYAGSTYTVTQSYTPATGAEITDTSKDDASHLMPGYFADASLQFDLTERTGFFAGAVFQSAGSYTQTLASTAAHYSTKIDLANQNGMRAGMTIRF